MSSGGGGPCGEVQEGRQQVLTISGAATSRSWSWRPDSILVYRVAARIAEVEEPPLLRGRREVQRLEGLGMEAAWAASSQSQCQQTEISPFSSRGIYWGRRGEYDQVVREGVEVVGAPDRGNQEFLMPCWRV